MAKVKLHCPTCQKIGFIEISEDAIKNVARGLLAVNISEGIVCPHTFIAYVDKNFDIRDYFVADFQIELPQISSVEKVVKTTLPSKDIIDIDLIKLNLTAMALTYIIKSIFLKQKLTLISDFKFLYHHLFNFFEYITKEAFEYDISIISEEEYQSNKKQYKNSMVISGNKIINNYKKLINPKKLFIEKLIVSKFFMERELGYSYILLKNEFVKAYELTKSIVEFMKETKEKNENINILKITLKLEEVYGIKIHTMYLRFLIEIVKHYYGLPVPSFTDGFFDFL